MRAAAWPCSSRSRSSTSAASPASSTPNPAGRPSAAAWRRTSRCATEWNVPPSTRDDAGTSPRARWSISRDARRVNVNSRRRSAGTPSETSHATRAHSVVVLPVPAPARISNGPPACVAAARCSSLSSSSQYRSPVSATTAMGRRTLRRGSGRLQAHSRMLHPTDAPAVIGSLAMDAPARPLRADAARNRPACWTPRGPRSPRPGSTWAWRRSPAAPASARARCTAASRPRRRSSARSSRTSSTRSSASRRAPTRSRARASRSRATSTRAPHMQADNQGFYDVVARGRRRGAHRPSSARASSPPPTRPLERAQEAGRRARRPRARGRARSCADARRDDPRGAGRRADGRHWQRYLGLLLDAMHPAPPRSSRRSRGCIPARQWTLKCATRRVELLGGARQVRRRSRRSPAWKPTSPASTPRPARRRPRTARRRRRPRRRRSAARCESAAICSTAAAISAIR